VTTDDAKLRRAAVVRIYDVGELTVLLGRDGRGHELSGDSARLARAVLAFLESPHTRAEILEHLEALVGGPIENAAVVADLLSLLLGVEAIEPAGAFAPKVQRHGPGARVVLGLTGAVASMHAPVLVQSLLDRGLHVRVAATTEALRFVRAEPLEALTHHRVVSDLWPVDTAMAVPHIDLAEWADAVLVCPASATTLSRIAGSDHSSIVSAIAIATRAPVMLVPSMNAAMYASPAVQRNLALLIEDGKHVVHPVAGIEVADRPHERVPTLGAAPPPSVVLALFDTMMRTHVRKGGLAPRTGDDWDAVYRRPPAELPWHRDDADADLVDELQRITPASVLDVGTGLGTLAVRFAALGHRVVATDVSTRALELARAAAPDADIVWLHDDITATKLHAAFDVVVDRGCLHLLAAEEARAYAHAMKQLVRADGHLVVKAFVTATASSRGTHPYDAAKLQALLGDAFALVRESASTLPGPADAPEARLFVLRRT
jgi:SAM-dependent methyltransferase/3-polyprenyl-4-hydroxybenzoate decarboxylase